MTSHRSRRSEGRRLGTNRWRIRLPRTPGGRLTAIATVVALLPVWFGAIWAGANGWWPAEDDARTILNMQDIFNGHPPLIGAQASTGLYDSALAAHHPGPVEFYVLAPFVLLLGPTWGLLVGLAALHSVAIVLTCRGGWLLGGSRLVVPIGAALAFLASGDDYARVFQPVNTIPPLFFLALMPVAAALAVLGRPWWTLSFAVAATVVAQGQLAYAPLAAVLSAALCVLGMVRWYQIRRSVWPLPGLVPWPRPKWRPGWLTTFTVAILWFPPVWETMTFRPGNLQQLWRYLVSDRPPRDLDLGHEILRFLAWPAPVPGVGDWGRAVLSVALMVAAGWLAVRLKHNRRRGPAWLRTSYLLTGFVLAGLLLEVILLAMTLPTGSGVWATSYWMTPLKVLSAMLWGVVVWQLARSADRAVNTQEGLVALRARASVSGILVALLLAGWSIHATTNFDTDKNRSHWQAAEMALPLLADRAQPGSFVRVRHAGGMDRNPGHAMQYFLSAHGYTVCAAFNWPVAERADYRNWAGCSPDSPIVMTAVAGSSLDFERDYFSGTWTRVGTTGTWLEGTNQVPSAYDVYLVTWP